LPIRGLNKFISSLNNYVKLNNGSFCFVYNSKLNRALLDVLITQNIVLSYCLATKSYLLKVWLRQNIKLRFHLLSTLTKRQFAKIDVLRKLFYARPSGFFLISTVLGFFSLQDAIFLGLGGELLFEVSFSC